MASLTGSSIASSYTSLLKLNGNSDTLVDGDGSNAIQIVDGDGTGSALYLNKDKLGIGGQPHVNSTLNVKNSSGTAFLYISSATDADSAIVLEENTSAKWIIGNDGNDSDNLKFGTGGGWATETKMTLTAGGSLGIGESSSIDKKLHIKSSTSGDGITIENSSTGASVVRFEADSSALRGIFGVEDHDGGSTITGSSGYATFIRSEADIQFASGGNNLAVTIDSSQNVSIGTTATYGNLTVGGTGEIISGRASSGAGSFSMYEGGTGRFVIESLNGSGGMAFKTPSTARMILDDNSRISLSNNDSGTSNTVFGKLAGNQIGSGDNYNVFVGESVGQADMTNATNNVGMGYYALSALTTADSTTAIGSLAGGNLTTGGNNTYLGANAGLYNQTGTNNTYIGKASGAGASGNSNSNNTALGGASLNAITTGGSNVCLGVNSGLSATTSSNLTIIGTFAGDAINDTGADGTVAVGYQALTALTSGDGNTAVGFESLKTNTDGDKNTAVGYQALMTANPSISGRGENTCIGYQAGKSLTTSQSNTFVGFASGDEITTGEANVAVGAGALHNADDSESNNTCIGYVAGDVIDGGSNNVCIGSLSDPSGATGTNQTVIGYNATGQADNSVTLGDADVTAVYMAEDSGAIVYAGGATFEGSASQTTIDLKATANNYIVGLSNSSGRIDLRPGGTTALTAINNGNVSVTGALSKGSGSFKIDHPLESKKDTHHLVHSFVEAPQADNIYRGKATLSSGSVEINLDTVSGMSEGTFVLLNTDIQCFTSNESDWDAVKGSVSGNILTISCQNTDSTANVSWLVIGERQDDHMKETDWTDENGKVIVEPKKPEE